MKRINKLIALFFLSFIILMIAVWTFVQSEYFSYYVNNLIEKSISKISNLDFRFNKLDLQFFPPGVNLKSVRVSYQTEDIQVKGQLSEVGIFFNNPGIIFKSLDFRSIKFEEGKLDVQIPNFKRTENKQNSRDREALSLRRSEILKIIKEKFKISLSTFLVKDVQLKLNNSFAWLKRVDVRNKGDFHQFHLLAFNSCAFDCNKYMVDTIEFDSLYFDDTVDIKNLKININQNEVESSGVITNLRNINKIKFDLLSSLNLDASSIHNYLEFRDVGEISNGLVLGKIKTKGRIDKFINEVKLKGFEIVSDFADVDKAELSLTIDNNEVRFNKAHLETENGALDLLKPFQFFDFKKKLFVEEPIFANARNVHLNNALKYINDIMSPLKGYLNGDIKFSLFKDYFVFENSTGIVGKDISLVFDNKEMEKFKVFHVNELELDSARFEIRDGDLYFDVLSDPNSAVQKNKFIAKGKIGSKGVESEVRSLSFELGDLNKIGGIDLSGKFEGNIKIDGPLENVIMKVKGNVENGVFEKIKLGQVENEMEVHLSKKKLIINSLNYHLNQSKSNLKLDIDFNNNKINGKAKSSNMLLADLMEMYSFYTDQTFLSNSGLNGEMGFEIDLSGSLGLKTIIANGELISKDIYMYNENIQQVSSKINFQNGQIKFKDTIFKLFSGLLKADFLYDVENEFLDYQLASNSLRIEYFNFYNSLPLNLKSRLIIDGKGRFQVQDPNKSIANFNLSLQESIMKDYKVPNSRLKISFSEEKASYETRIFGKKLESYGEFDFSSNAKENLETKRSFVKLSAESNEIKTLVDLFDFIKIDSSLINGTILYELNSKFNFYDPKRIEFTTHLKNLFISKGDIFLNYQSKLPEISVSNGVVNKWDIDISGQNILFQSKGSGDFKDNFNVNIFSSISASSLDIFKNYISSAKGKINFEFKAKNLKDKFDYGSRLFSSNLEISPNITLAQIKNSNIDISLKNNILNFDKFDLFFNKGNMVVGGEIDLNKIIPVLRLTFLADKISYPLLDKTEVVFSGKGEIIGRNPPYTLNGKILIDEFNVFNDFIDFANVNKNVFTENIKYLPEKDLDLDNNLFNFNINVESVESINVVNSMANLKFFGDIYLLGNEKKPKLSGKVELLPGEQKFFFKNNEFSLSRGQLTFVDRKDYKNPDLDIQGAATINDYDLEVKVFGDIDEPVFDLSSDPPLAKNDILSLIAFGYTRNISENLTSGDREALTQAGVGGILFDQLKINETLKNEFGLKVNLGTEFDRDSQNFLGQRTSSTGVSRTRSATKVELRKDINKAMDLSVSSTIGGSIGSKQSMKLNYSLNKDISVDGVYEIKSNEEGEQNLNTDSLGFDVKYRKSFK